MSAQVERIALEPSISVDTGAGDLQTEYLLLEPRFVFSPFKTIDTSFDLCAVRQIPAGAICCIDNHTYQDRNIKRVENHDSGEPEFIFARRKAGHIIRGLLDQYRVDGMAMTGFRELNSLRGLDPKIPGDAELLRDIQRTLLPYKLGDGYEQLEFLMGRKEAAEVKGARYVGALDEMLAATSQGIEYCQVQVEEVKGQLANASSGKAGFKSRPDEEDKRVCDWIREPYPAIASPLQPRGAAAAPFDGQALAQSIADGLARALPSRDAQGVTAAVEADQLSRTQCPNCGEMIPLIAGELPKVCRFCRTSPAKILASQAKE